MSNKLTSFLDRLNPKSDRTNQALDFIRILQAGQSLEQRKAEEAAQQARFDASLRQDVAKLGLEKDKLSLRERTHADLLPVRQSRAESSALSARTGASRLGREIAEVTPGTPENRAKLRHAFENSLYAGRGKAAAQSEVRAIAPPQVKMPGRSAASRRQSIEERVAAFATDYPEAVDYIYRPGQRMGSKDDSPISPSWRLDSKLMRDVLEAPPEPTFAQSLPLIGGLWGEPQGEGLDRSRMKRFHDMKDAWRAIFVEDQPQEATGQQPPLDEREAANRVEHLKHVGPPVPMAYTAMTQGVAGATPSSAAAQDPSAVPPMSPVGAEGVVPPPPMAPPAMSPVGARGAVLPPPMVLPAMMPSAPGASDQFSGAPRLPPPILPPPPSQRGRMALPQTPLPTMAPPQQPTEYDPMTGAILPFLEYPKGLPPQLPQHPPSLTEAIAGVASQLGAMVPSSAREAMAPLGKAPEFAGAIADRFGRQLMEAGPQTREFLDRLIASRDAGESAGAAGEFVFGIAALPVAVGQDIGMMAKLGTQVGADAAIDYAAKKSNPLGALMFTSIMQHLAAARGGPTDIALTAQMRSAWDRLFGRSVPDATKAKVFSDAQHFAKFEKAHSMFRGAATEGERAAAYNAMEVVAKTLKERGVQPPKLPPRGLIEASTEPQPPAPQQPATPPPEPLTRRGPIAPPETQRIDSPQRWSPSLDEPPTMEAPARSVHTAYDLIKRQASQPNPPRPQAVPPPPQLPAEPPPPPSAPTQQPSAETDLLNELEDYASEIAGRAVDATDALKYAEAELSSGGGPAEIAFDKIEADPEAFRSWFESLAQRRVGYAGARGGDLSMAGAPQEMESSLRDPMPGFFPDAPRPYRSPPMSKFTTINRPEPWYFGKNVGISERNPKRYPPFPHDLLDEAAISAAGTEAIPYARELLGGEIPAAGKEAGERERAIDYSLENERQLDTREKPSPLTSALDDPERFFPQPSEAERLPYEVVRGEGKGITAEDLLELPYKKSQPRAKVTAKEASQLGIDIPTSPEFDVPVARDGVVFSEALESASDDVVVSAAASAFRRIQKDSTAKFRTRREKNNLSYLQKRYRELRAAVVERGALAKLEKALSGRGLRGRSLADLVDRFQIKDRFLGGVGGGDALEAAVVPKADATPKRVIEYGGRSESSPAKAVAERMVGWTAVYGKHPSGKLASAIHSKKKIIVDADAISERFLLGDLTPYDGENVGLTKEVFDDFDHFSKFMLDSGESTFRRFFLEREAAHVGLGHGDSRPTDRAEMVKREREANELAFERIGYKPPASTDQGLLPLAQGGGNPPQVAQGGGNPPLVAQGGGNPPQATAQGSATAHGTVTAGAIEPRSRVAKAYVRLQQMSGQPIDEDFIRIADSREIGTFEPYDLYVEDMVPELAPEMKSLRHKDTQITSLQGKLEEEYTNTVGSKFTPKELEALSKVNDAANAIRRRIGRAALRTPAGQAQLDAEMDAHLKSLDPRELEAWNAWEKWTQLAYKTSLTVAPAGKTTAPFRKYYFPFVGKRVEYWIKPDDIPVLGEENLHALPQVGGYPRERDPSKVLPNYLNHMLKKQSGFTESMSVFKKQLISKLGFTRATAGRMREMLDKWSGTDHDPHMDPGAIAARDLALSLERAVERVGFQQRGYSDSVEAANLKLDVSYQKYKNSNGRRKSRKLRAYLREKANFGALIDKSVALKRVHQAVGSSPIASLANGVLSAKLFSALGMKHARYTAAQLIDFAIQPMLMADNLSDAAWLTKEMPVALLRSVKDVSREIAANAPAKIATAFGADKQSLERVIDEAATNIRNGLSGGGGGVVLDAIAEHLVKHYEMQARPGLESTSKSFITRTYGKGSKFRAWIDQFALAPFSTGDHIIGLGSAMVADAFFRRKLAAWNKLSGLEFADSLGPMLRGQEGTHREIAALMEQGNVDEARLRYAFLMAEETVVPSHISANYPLYVEQYLTQQGWGRLIGGMMLQFTRHPVRRLMQLRRAASPRKPGILGGPIAAAKTAGRAGYSALLGAAAVAALVKAMNMIFAEKGKEEDVSKSAYMALEQAPTGAMADVHPAVWLLKRTLEGQRHGIPLSTRPGEMLPKIAEQLPGVGPASTVVNAATKHLRSGGSAMGFPRRMTKVGVGNTSAEDALKYAARKFLPEPKSARERAMELRSQRIESNRRRGR